MIIQKLYYSIFLRNRKIFLLNTMILLYGHHAKYSWIKSLIFYRLRFVPDDGNVKPTCIVNLSAHPEVTGLTTDDNPGDVLSSDYTAYMEQIINEEGYNFMFLSVHHP